MNMDLLIIGVVAAILIWLSVLTFVFGRLVARYRLLARGSTRESWESILKKILKEENLNATEIADITERVSRLEKEGLTHIQKVGMVRFNPFDETGGDNSFTLCLLDGNFDGVLLTGLHTREKTRIYAKKLENGKSRLMLSKEEKEAIEGAVK